MLELMLSMLEDLSSFSASGIPLCYSLELWGGKEYNYLNDSSYELIKKKAYFFYIESEFALT